jgi:RNA polymerase sigma factor (TIGR02999 family)
MGDVPFILQQMEEGESPAAEELLPLVYDELLRAEACRLANERPGQTLQATALVHEACLRLVGKDDPQWNGQRHFFSAAAEATRRILAENAGRKNRVKHSSPAVQRLQNHET